VPNKEPLLNSVAVTDLRPTQITVGLREVAEKRRGWDTMPEADRPEFLARHMIPVLLGPKKRFYVIDHHHLARALLDEGCETVQVNVVADLSSTLHISGCVAGEVSEAVVDFGWSFGRLATTRACQQSRVGPYLASNGS